jgi:hypothetical protein
MTAKEGHFAGVKDSLQLRMGTRASTGTECRMSGEPLLAGGDERKHLHVFGLQHLCRQRSRTSTALTLLHHDRPTDQVSQRREDCDPERTDGFDALDRLIPYCSVVLHPKCPVYRRSHRGRVDDPPREPSVMLHRFTLIKPGASGKKLPTGVSQGITSSASHGPSEAGWSPFDFFFSSGLVAKCDLCHKRLGWKPVLECDDCGLR